MERAEQRRAIDLDTVRALMRTPPVTRSTRRARPRRSTRSGCSMTGSCGSIPPTRPPRIATASSSVRATGRSRSTRSWRPRGSSRRRGSTRSWTRGGHLGSHPDRAARARRRGVDRLVRPWPADRDRHRVGAACEAAHRAAGRGAVRRRRAERGLELGGDPACTAAQLGNLTLLVIDNHSSRPPCHRGWRASSVRLGRPRRRRARSRRARARVPRAHRSPDRGRRRHPGGGVVMREMRRRSARRARAARRRRSRRDRPRRDQHRLLRRAIRGTRRAS